MHSLTSREYLRFKYLHLQRMQLVFRKPSKNFVYKQHIVYIPPYSQKCANLKMVTWELFKTSSLKNADFRLPLRALFEWNSYYYEICSYTRIGYALCLYVTGNQNLRNDEMYYSSLQTF